MSGLLILVLASSVWDAPRTLVFGERDRWVMYHTTEGRAEGFTPPLGFEVQGAAATSSGDVLILVARPKDSPVWGLYRWRPKTERSLTELISSKGYFANVSVSPGDKWVYFSHHPQGGPVGRHAQKAFAQLHRVKIDGSGLEQLTKSDGCKLGACPLPKGGVLMLHSDCAGGGEIDVLDATGTEKAVGDHLTEFSDMNAAPDGETALLVGSSMLGPRLLEWSRKTRQIRVVAEGFVTAAHGQYGKNRDEILAWNDGLVRVVAGKLETVPVALAGKVGAER